MKLEDIIALAKQGYKPSDIKELVALATPEQTQTDTPTVTEIGADAQGKQTAESEQVTPSENVTEPETTETTLDYKAMYEKSQADLKALQEKNTHQTITTEPEKDDATVFAEAIRGLM